MKYILIIAVFLGGCVEQELITQIADSACEEQIVEVTKSEGAPNTFKITITPEYKDIIYYYDNSEHHFESSNGDCVQYIE